MKQADVYMLSSIYEGMPNAMLEAMYLGLPIAATQCIPFISQVVEEGENGYICPVGNEKALAECMINASKMKGLPIFRDINQSEEGIVETFKGLFTSNCSS